MILIKLLSITVVRNGIIKLVILRGEALIEDLVELRLLQLVLMLQEVLLGLFALVDASDEFTHYFNTTAISSKFQGVGLNVNEDLFYTFFV